MANTHGSKASFFMGTQATPTVLVDYSTYFNTAGIPWQRDKAEVSTFHAIEKAYVAGLLDAAIPIDGPFDPSIDGVLFASLGGTAVNFAYYPQGSTTGLVMYTGSIFIVKYEIKSEMGSAASFSAEGQISGLVTRALAP